MVSEFRSRRDFLHQALSAIDGVVCPLPEGAFYLFPDVSSFFGMSVGGRAISSSSDLCLYLMEDHNVALVPGDAFGAPRGMRISYAASMDDLREAARRVANGLRALSNG